MYPRPIELAQFNLLDSHDTARFITIARGDEAACASRCSAVHLPRRALHLLRRRDRADRRATRCAARKTFPWAHPETWNGDLLSYYKELVALRHAQPALRSGAYRSLAANKSSYAFARTPRRRR